MKTKPEPKPLWNNLTEDEILQLSNNLSEGLPCGNVRDWRAVAKYWRDQHDRICLQAEDMRRRVLRLALDLNE